MEVLCPLCNLQNETVRHILTECPVAMAAWFMSPLGLHWNIILGHSFLFWFKSLSVLMKGDNLDVAAMVAWSIWNGKNNTIHGSGICNPELEVNKSLVLLSDYQKVNMGSLAGVNTRSMVTHRRWNKPPAHL